MTYAKPFLDTFTDQRRRGRVVGSRAPDGTRRDGIDVEGVLSVDNGALRIQPLIEAGWNRACLSYGPFERCSGLVLAVSMINGHNTSQAEQLPDTFKARLRRWLLGGETSRARDRAVKWITAGRVRRVLRQFRWWSRTAKDRPKVERLDENLAVGWFPRVDSNPMHEGTAFVMHATGPENGELWRRVAGELVPVIRGVQNLHIYYVVALRPDSAVYYAASIAQANGFTAYPNMRPLGIEARSYKESEIWASIHQSHLGQIGFRLDTRVFGVAVAHVDDWRPWHGGAHAADRLTGDGPLAGSRELLGCPWQASSGLLVRSGCGVVTAGGAGSCVLSLRELSGLIRCGFRGTEGDGWEAVLRWRMQDRDNYWEIRLDAGEAELSILLDGMREVVLREDRPARPSAELQIVDDGRTLALSLDGTLMFGRLINDARLADAAGLAIELQDGGSGAVSAGPLEAHPRQMPIPSLLDLGKPWLRSGESLRVSDDFVGETAELDGRRTPVGGKRWKRILGDGRFELTGAGSVRVCASRERPAPGRVMYTLDWDHEELADIEVIITPPGSGRGEGENGLAGVVAWQDDDNYVTINSWICDGYPGASISCFFKIRGWEDLYDAIWSNVGSRVRHGHPYRLRLVFDGMHYLVFVDDEPVVYRALTDVYDDCKRLSIRRVGIITNWEWGLDTGSVFRDFRVRS